MKSKQFDRGAEWLKLLEALDDPAFAAGIDRYRFDDLLVALAEEKDHAGGAWDECIAHVQQTALFRHFQTEPICYRSHTRPRGYSGDAALIDAVYRRCPETISGPGTSLPTPNRALFRLVVNSRAPQVVRTRALLTGQRIDAVCQRTARPKILSVACGHLEELNRSVFIHDSEAVIDAVDQDELSLAECENRFGAERIEAHQLSVSKLLGSTKLPGPYDLIFCGGLFDYLEDRFAQRLTASLAERLSSGGGLLIWNFGQGLHEAAFMDSIMDWRLIYRNSSDMERMSPDGFTSATESWMGDCLHLLEVKSATP